MKKKYELRVTCFGDYLVAAKLNSQVHADGLIDWRAIRSEQMAIEPYDLPETVANNIRKFMRTIGIVFGSFDFIVTPEDDYIFLEVNEQGQFLWIEEYNPSFRMLDIFIQFLMNKSVDFKWDSNGIEHSIQNYRDEIDLIYTQNMHRHIDLNRANI